MQQPRTVKAGERISIEFWRCVDPEKVWYEWQLVEPIDKERHNMGGAGYNMRL